MTNLGEPVGEEDLHAWVDGRLAPERIAAVEDYLAARPEERSRVSQYAEQRLALRSVLAGQEIPIPVRLRVGRLTASSRDRRRRQLAQLAAAILLLVVGGAVGWAMQEFAGPLVWGTAAARSIAADAVAAHRTFAVEARHPVEVPADEQAHLGQWLSNRLGRPLIIPDLTAFGLQLMGGRLLPSETGPAAQLMYDDTSGGRLTVYLRTGVAGDTRLYEAEDSVSALLWIDEGFGCAIVGRSDRDFLTRVAESVYEQLLPDSPKGEISRDGKES